MKVLCVLAAAALSFSAWAQKPVSGHFKKDGTYVAPHQKTAPNERRNDNYSTRGNVNPYTGKSGTKPKDEDRPAPRRP